MTRAGNERVAAAVAERLRERGVVASAEAAPR
jgi:hypothetical protein